MIVNIDELIPDKARREKRGRNWPVGATVKITPDRKKRQQNFMPFERDDKGYFGKLPLSGGAIEIEYPNGKKAIIIANVKQQKDGWRLDIIMTMRNNKPQSYTGLKTLEKAEELAQIIVRNKIEELDYYLSSDNRS